jgi:hypothetical protein
VGVHRHQPQFAQPVPSYLLVSARRGAGSRRDVSTIRVAL